MDHLSINWGRYLLFPPIGECEPNGTKIHNVPTKKCTTYYNSWEKSYKRRSAETKTGFDAWIQSVVDVVLCWEGGETI